MTWYLNILDLYLDKPTRNWQKTRENVKKLENPLTERSDVGISLLEKYKLV